MARSHASRQRLGDGLGLVAAAWVLLGAGSSCPGDTVFLKNGLIFNSQVPVLSTVGALAILIGILTFLL